MRQPEHGSDRVSGVIGDNGINTLRKSRDACKMAWGGLLGDPTLDKDHHSDHER